MSYLGGGGGASSAQTYKGSWDADTNTPTIVSGVGIEGDYYIVTVDGTTTIDGTSVWAVGDKISFNGTVWQKIPTSDAGSLFTLDQLQDEARVHDQDGFTQTINNATDWILIDGINSFTYSPIEGVFTDGTHTSTLSKVSLTIADVDEQSKILKTGFLTEDTTNGTKVELFNTGIIEQTLNGNGVLKNYSNGTNTWGDYIGSGDPEGVQVGNVNSTYLDVDTGTRYEKKTGTGNTGWENSVGLEYKGSWNADTNTPTLVSGTGVNGNYYIVSVDGTTTIDGEDDWKAGDWIIFQDTTDTWQKIDQTENIPFEESFLVADWVNTTGFEYTITITETTHLKGVNVKNVFVQEDDGTSYIPVGVDNLTINKTTGDVVVTISGAVDPRFNGRVIID